MAISVSQIEILRGKLEEMPEVENPDRKISNLEAIRMMASSIRDLQSRGYSIEKIAEILRESGLEIAPTTLKSYLTKVKGSPGKSNSRSSGKPRRPSSSTSREVKKKASEKPAASVATKPTASSKTSAGVTPVPPGSFTPKEDSDEI
jgi:predicted transcriptional regulator